MAITQDYNSKKKHVNHLNLKTIGDFYYKLKAPYGCDGEWLGDDLGGRDDLLVAQPHADLGLVDAQQLGHDRKVLVSFLENKSNHNFIIEIYNGYIPNFIF